MADCDSSSWTSLGAKSNLAVAVRFEPSLVKLARGGSWLRYFHWMGKGCAIEWAFLTVSLFDTVSAT